MARLYVGLAPRHVWQNGLVLVEISLQGDEELHDRIVQRKGSWRRAVQGLEHMVRLRNESGRRFPKFDLKLVVTKDTVSELVPFVRLASSLGVDLVNFLAEHDLMGNAEGGKPQHLDRPQRVPEGVDPGLLRQELIRAHELARDSGVQVRLTPNVPIDEFVRHYRRDRALDPSEYVCEGPWSRIGVAADGRLSPMCPYTAGGDLRTETLRSMWNSERIRSFRRETQASRVYAGCHGCCNLKYVGKTAYGLAGVSADESHLDLPMRGEPPRKAVGM
jgi:MoaA/NifB/PqqE/SkfB family radical SAM enzyme